MEDYSGPLINHFPNMTAIPSSEMQKIIQNVFGQPEDDSKNHHFFL